jgi:hypothetical protein
MRNKSSDSEKSLGKPMRRWEDNINNDLKDWIYLVQDMT